MLSQTLMFTYFLQVVAFASGYPDRGGTQYPKCKPIPGDQAWPSLWEWGKLNLTLSGRLISPAAPGGVCHPTYPTFNPLLCPVVAENWHYNAFHAADPVSNTVNNWNNDTCLPIPGLPCSGAGYPVYVINATTAQDVKKGVDFARRSGVRLIVKGTGHDYLGRSTAPNSLSIWTRHIQGLQFHEKGAFKPKSCRKSKVTTSAVTIAAGVPMIEINREASIRNLTILSGGAASVGLGGYLSGGGHGAISHVFGLAADQVLEMEVVTPNGEIMIANECLNEDLFWALRGGGGSTFGVMTSVTIKAFPSFRYAVVFATIGTPTVNTDSFFNALTTLLSLFPSLSDQGISAYSDSATNYNASSLGIPFLVHGFQGTFQLPLLHPENTTASLLSAVKSVFAQALATSDPSVQWIQSFTPAEYTDFYTYFKDHNGPENGGENTILSSWLLDRNALTSDKAKLKKALVGAVQSGFITAHLISGRGVHNTSGIPGGGNAVNPAFRKAYVHAITGVSFPPFSPELQEKQHNLLTNSYGAAMRELAPNSGSYINEADPREPDYQHAFWGSNYERLLKIKKKVDPWGLFWCAFCVGGEAWRVVGGRVCQV